MITYNYTYRALHSLCSTACTHTGSVQRTRNRFCPIFTDPTERTRETELGAFNKVTSTALSCQIGSQKIVEGQLLDKVLFFGEVL